MPNARKLTAVACCLLGAALSNLRADAGTGAGSGHLSRGNCAALGLPACPEPYDARIPDPKDMLLWSQPERVIGFRNTFRMYGGDVFHVGEGKTYPLPPARCPLPSIGYRLNGRRYGLEDYLRRQSVTGLLILKDGAVAYEYYGNGNTDKTLWTSRSVAKSVVSILIGIAIRDGAIKSVNDPIVDYLPELRESAWRDVTLRQLLQHTSGVAWNENYADPDSDFARLTRCEAARQPYGCVFGLIRSVKRSPGVRPGERWSYNTGGAWLAGRVLERATAMPIAAYLQARIWSRFAMESDGVWEALLPGRVDMGGHGFNATLRDWGRFALFVSRGGELPSGERLLPPDWIRDSTNWTWAEGSVTPTTPDGQYGYQWWFLNAASPTERVTETAKQSFWAEGIYGQSIAIDPSRKLVLVQWSAWEKAEMPDAFYDEQAVFLDAVSRSL
jgi:CubicO group peptidase (beta-lactamase class C family)